ncbi:thionin-like protein 2 [Rosa sericea]
MDKIEKMGVISVTIISFLVLSVVLGGLSTASDGPDCSTGCNLCLFAMVAGPWWGTGCAAACATGCFIADRVNNNSLISIPKSDEHYFCNVGCASNFCSSFLAKPNPELEKRCLNSCSETCKTKNTLPHE